MIFHPIEIVRISFAFALCIEFLDVQESNVVAMVSKLGVPLVSQEGALVPLKQG